MKAALSYKCLALLICVVVSILKTSSSLLINSQLKGARLNTKLKLLENADALFATSLPLSLLRQVEASQVSGSR